MMARCREKREKAGEKLKDIIESLKGPKATKSDIETFILNYTLINYQ
jgi:hypothetical protein